MIERMLALDSLVNVLSLSERIGLQKSRITTLENHYKPTELGRMMFSLICIHNWHPPQRKYDEDRIEIWLNPITNEWEPISTYKDPIINEIINQIPVTYE